MQLVQSTLYIEKATYFVFSLSSFMLSFLHFLFLLAAFFTLILDEIIKFVLRSNAEDQSRWNGVRDGFRDVIAELHALRHHIINLENGLQPKKEKPRRRPSTIVSGDATSATSPRPFSSVEYQPLPSVDLATLTPVPIISAPSSAAATAAAVSFASLPPPPLTHSPQLNDGLISAAITASSPSSSDPSSSSSNTLSQLAAEAESEPAARLLNHDQ